jgi:hypothetical protein
MSVERIKVVFKQLYVRDDSDWWGSGEFYFIANVDGSRVGDSDRNRQIFEAVEGRAITLPQDRWSAEVDVRNKSEVRISFHVMEDDIFSDDDVGTVNYVLRPPWRQRRLQSRNRFFILYWQVQVPVRGRFGWHGPLEVAACRQRGSDTTCTTVTGNTVRHRIEICPVNPLLADNQLPSRPLFPAGTQGWDGEGTYFYLNPQNPINIFPNPPVIPILSRAQENTAAKI